MAKEVYTLRVQPFGNRRVFALCNHSNRDLCTVPHSYVTGRLPPNYPVPAIDYYNSANPSHVAIGNLMEWSIPVETQLKFRG